MIKLTLEKFAEALGSGAYRRFGGIRKAIAAGHNNRKVPEAVDKEWKHFIETRDGILKQFEGKLNEDKTDFVYPDEEKKAAADKALKELMALEVELPGEPMKLTDLLDGGLLESDYKFLEPFLSE